MKTRMTPSHPDKFIRTEVIESLDLNVTRGAQILGVRRATLSALLNDNAALPPEMALRAEKAFGVGIGMLPGMDAGLIRRLTNATARNWDHRSALPACLTNRRPPTTSRQPPSALQPRPLPGAGRSTCYIAGGVCAAPRS